MEPEDLRIALVERLGDGPGFVVTKNEYPSLIEGSYGFYVAYDKGSITMREVRDAVDELTPWEHSAILHEREPYRPPGVSKSREP